MTDLLGAAPYMPERPPLRSRLVLWWRSLLAPAPLHVRGGGVTAGGAPCSREPAPVYGPWVNPTPRPWCGRLHPLACDGGSICRGDIVYPLR